MLQLMIITQFKIEISDSCLLWVIIGIQVTHPKIEPINSDGNKNKKITNYKDIIKAE